jgi:hypothetical protein
MAAKRKISYQEIPVEWIADFLTERSIEWEMGPPMRYDKFGHEYVTLGLGGIETYEPPLAGSLVTYATTERAAIEHYKKMLLEFLGSDRFIVWRTLPEMQHATIGEFMDQYRMFSRLISYPERIA